MTYKHCLSCLGTLIGSLILLMYGFAAYQAANWGIAVETRPDFAKQTTNVITVSGNDGLASSMFVLTVVILWICSLSIGNVRFSERIWRTPRSRPLTISVALLISSGGFVYFGHNADFSCERSKSICTLTKTGYWWSETQSFSLQELKGAYIKTTTTQDSEGNQNNTYDVAVVIAQTEIRFPHHTNLPEAQEISEQVNQFIQQSTQESLQVNRRDRSGAIAIAIALVIVSFITFRLGSKSGNAIN
ncbi:hypothetical protein ACQ4M3_16005 [Leptolyngbya sp. AN03gr2]|uniref:hypothetical protein n=1 Tax=unclassified Leptolyngbya TaxID=2650499 RepID=UPI003D3209FF